MGKVQKVLFKKKVLLTALKPKSAVGILIYCTVFALQIQTNDFFFQTNKKMISDKSKKEIRTSKKSFQTNENSIFRQDNYY